MSKYIKNPVTVDAIQWTGKNVDEINHFMNRPNILLDDNNGVLIYTSDKYLTASVGDYIIKDIKGTYYPCEQGVFIVAYSPS